MHENANINFQSQESECMICTILNIQPREGGSVGKLTPDQIVSEIAQIQLEDMPVLINLEVGHKDLFDRNDMGLVPSLTTVLI